MARGTNYKSEEARAREALHQFGGKEPNPSGKQSVATQEELEKYVANKTNPYARRKFIQAITGTVTMHEFFELTDQTHGKPKEQVEVSTDKETAAAIRAEWDARYGNKG